MIVLRVVLVRVKLRFDNSETNTYYCKDCKMGLMSDEILGGTSDDELDLRTTLKLTTKRLNVTTKSYLSNAKDKKKQSDQRRDKIKSSLFSVLDQDDMSYDYSIASEPDSGESFASIRICAGDSSLSLGALIAGAGTFKLEPFSSRR